MFTIVNNVILNSCTYPAAGANSPGFNDQDGGDCGAIYTWDEELPSSTNIQISNNYIDDVNAPSNGAGDWGTDNTTGIYMDDGVSNTTVTGNIVFGIKSSCFVIHGGDNNAMTGNIC